MKLPQRSSIYLTFCLLILAPLFFINFANNQFSIIGKHWFSTWQSDSSALVIGRLIENERNGLFSHSGFMGRANEWPTQLDDYKKGKDIAFNLYTGNANFQSAFYVLAQHVFNATTIEDTIKLSNNINTCMLIMLCFVFLYWVFYEFGMLAFITTTCSFFFSSWIIVSARELYWIVWTMLLPSIAVLYCMYIEEKNGKNYEKRLYLLVFITVFMRSLCGYEFLSTILITMTLPFFYYSLKNKHSKRKILRRLCFIVLFSLFAFLFALLTHFFLLYIEFGSTQSALIQIVNRISYRTGLLGSSGVEEIYKKSLEASFYSIVRTYLSDGHPLYGALRLSKIFIFFSSFLLVGMLLYAKNRKDTKLVALIAIFFISFCAHLSWIFLARGHAYIHTHINYLLWTTSLFLPFFAVLIGYIAQYLIVELFRISRV